jgi:hypothetical protein
MYIEAQKLYDKSLRKRTAINVSERTTLGLLIVADLRAHVASSRKRDFL